MWLLKFHFAFSILCMLTIFGFYWIFRKTISENGWGHSRVKYGSLKRCLLFLRGVLAFTLCAFIPVLNVMLPWCLLYMNSHENPEREDGS